MKFKIRFADQIVGFFSIVALIALIVLIFSLGINQKWFVKKNYYYTVFDSASGISTGTDLTYRGFSLGKVKSLKLVGSMVRVDYYVLSEYATYVKENSLVELITSPIGLGNSFILHPGSGPGLIPDGGEIFRLDSVPGQKIVAEGKNRIRAQTDSIGALFNKVSLLLDNVNSLLTDLNDAINGKTNTPIAEILQNITLTTDNIVQMVSSITASDNYIAPLLGDGAYNEIYALLENINRVSSDLHNISSDAAPQLNQILYDLDKTMSKAKDVLEGVKNNPLIKGGVPDRSNESSATTKIRNKDF